MDNDTRLTAVLSKFVFSLTIIFVVAKIFNLIHWSWWLVFSPLWGPIVFLLMVSLIVWIFFKIHGDL